MSRSHVRRLAAVAVALGSLVLSAERLHAGAPATQRPKPQGEAAPAPQEPSAEEKAKRRAERERKAQAERQQAEQERVRRAREQAAGAKPPPGGASESAGMSDAQAAARELFHIEAVHRDRLARIERLLEVYREAGDQEKLVKLEQMRAKENKRYGNIVAQLQARMGGRYAEVESRLAQGRERVGRRGMREDKDGGKPVPTPPRPREAKADGKGNSARGGGR